MCSYDMDFSGLGRHMEVEIKINEDVFGSSNFDATLFALCLA